MSPKYGYLVMLPLAFLMSGCPRPYLSVEPSTICPGSTIDIEYSHIPEGSTISSDPEIFPEHTIPESGNESHQASPLPVGTTEIEITIDGMTETIALASAGGSKPVAFPGCVGTTQWPSVNLPIDEWSPDIEVQHITAWEFNDRPITVTHQGIMSELLEANETNPVHVGTPIYGSWEVGAFSPFGEGCSGGEALAETYLTPPPTLKITIRYRCPSTP